MMRRSIDAHCHCEAQRAVAISSFDSMLHLNHRRFPRRFAPRNDKWGGLLDKLEFENHNFISGY